MNNINAQQYLEKNLERESEKIISEGSLKLLKGQKLTGDLIIQDYPNLEEIDLGNQELTSLKVINCPSLKFINAYHNQLTKLEVIGTKKLLGVIAGQNELTTLNFSDCSDLERLIIPDNPLLSKIENLNLKNLKSFNITNTNVNLAQEIEQLKQEKQELLNIAKGTKQAQEEGEFLIPVQIITTPELAEEAIQKHLKKTEREWREYFANPQQALPAFQLPEWRRKAKQVLIWIIEAQTSRDYQGLANKWNYGDERSLDPFDKGLKYNGERDFDLGSLSKLMDLLKAYNNLKKENTSIEIYD